MTSGIGQATGRSLRIAAHGYIAVMLAAMVIPLAYAVLTSLQPAAVARSRTPQLLFTPTLDNYRDLFIEHNFTPYLINSFSSSFGAMMDGLVLGVPAAYLMSRRRFRGFWGMLLTVLAARALPAIGVAVPFFILFTQVRIIDQPVALILAYLPYNVALVTWLMRGLFDTVPRSLDEAAAIDGCGPLRVLILIIIPVSRSGLTASAVMAFLFGWNNFFFPLVLTQSKATTVPVALTQFVGQYVINWGQIMAGVTVLALPLLVITVVLRRYMTEGLTQGAVRE